MEDRCFHEEAVSERCGFHPAKFADCAARDDRAVAQRPGRYARDLQALPESRCALRRSGWGGGIDGSVWVEGRFSIALERSDWFRRHAEAIGRAHQYSG